MRITDSDICQASVAESSVTLPPEIGAWAMPDYRIYKLSPENRIVGVPETVEYESDQEVIAHTKEKLDGLDVEVWDGPRVVIRLKSVHK
jgi:hypothetical protein